MKRKLPIILVILALLVGVVLSVSVCSSSCSKGCSRGCTKGYAVVVTYDKTMGTVEGEGKYTENAVVTLTATPLEGYVFVGWYNGSLLLSEDLTYTFNMPKTKLTFTAKFIVEPVYPVTVNYDTERGIIEGIGSYKNNQQVSLTATPIEGFLFEGWYKEDQLLTNNATYTFTMTKQEVILTANFVVDDIDRVLTIKYVYEDNSKAHDDYVGNYKFNNLYQVPSPEITGYSPDTPIVTGNIKQSTTITVVYTINTYKLTINYVDEFNNPMVGINTYTDNIVYNEPYNVTSPVVNGYTADILEVSGTMPAGDKSIKVTYYRNDYTLTITYQGADEFTPQQYEQEYKFGDTYSVITQTIFGYNVDKDVVTGTIEDNTNVTVTYSPKNYKLTVNYLKNDDTTTLGSKVFENLIFNRDYQLDLDNFESSFYYLDSYSLIGKLTTTDALLGNIISNATTQELVLDITYTNKNRIIPVRYVDAFGNEIASSSTISKLIGDTYEVDSISIEGYTERETTLTGTITAALDQEIVFVYDINKYLLTINYIYEDNSTASATYTKEYNYNTEYEVTSPTITGYFPDIEVVRGNIGNGPKTIDVTYTPVSNNLTINYIYENGTTAAATYTADLDYNESYNILSPDITGYSPDKANVSGVMGLEDISVTVTYTINSYKLTINYISSVSGFDKVKPASIVETLNYQQSYSYQTPSISGLVADKAVVSGQMGASDLIIDVTYTAVDVNLTLSYVANGNYIQSSNKIHTIDFENNNKTITIENPYVWQNVGYRPQYTSLKLQIVNRNLQLIGINGSTQTVLYDEISNGLSYNLEFEKIVSTVTVYHRLDNSSIFENSTETYTQDYNTKITLSYKDFGPGYIPAGTTLEYTFKDYNENIYLEYTSEERQITINYLDIYGDKVATSYVRNHKYNTQFSIKSPDLVDYVLADENQAYITGTMGLSNLTYDVVYNLNWSSNDFNDLIIDTPLKLLELSKNNELWNRNVVFAADIDMSGIEIAPIGNYQKPFTGNINGANYTISNLTIDETQITLRTQTSGGVTYKYAYVGLFGCAFGIINKLNVENINISYKTTLADNITVYAGLLVGQYSGHSITSTTVSGTLDISSSLAYIGGIAGSNLSGTISQTTTNATIIGGGDFNTANFGGTVGINYTGTMENVNATLTINTLNAIDNLSIAGVVAESEEGFITNCSGTLNISSTGVTCQNNAILTDNICAKNTDTKISNN